MVLFLEYFKRIFLIVVSTAVNIDLGIDTFIILGKFLPRDKQGIKLLEREEESRGLAKTLLSFLDK